MSIDPTPTSRAERFTVEEATTTEAGRIRGIILDTIALRVGQVGDVHPRLLEGIEKAARLLADTPDAGLLREQEPALDPGWRIVEQADRADALASMIADAREALARRKGRMAAACEEAVEHLSRAPFPAAHKSRADLILATRDGSPRPVGVREQEPAQGGLTEAEEEALRHAVWPVEAAPDPRLRNLHRDVTAAVTRIKADAYAAGLAARGGTAAAGDDHRQRADHYEHLYQQASEGKCGPSGLTIGACKASICDCFEFPWVKPAPDEHPDPAPTAAAGDEGLRAHVESATGSMRSAVEVGPDCYTEEGWHALCVRLLAALDATPAPTEDPAPSQDTLRAAVEALRFDTAGDLFEYLCGVNYDEGIEADFSGYDSRACPIAVWLVEEGGDSVYATAASLNMEDAASPALDQHSLDLLAYPVTLTNRPVRAALAATTPEATAPSQETPLPTSIGGTVTVTGVVRTVETLHSPGHYRITLDAAAEGSEW